MWPTIDYCQFTWTLNLPEWFNWKKNLCCKWTLQAAHLKALNVVSNQESSPASLFLAFILKLPLPPTPTFFFYLFSCACISRIDDVWTASDSHLTFLCILICACPLCAYYVLTGQCVLKVEVAVVKVVLVVHWLPPIVAASSRARLAHLLSLHYWFASNKCLLSLFFDWPQNWLLQQHFASIKCSSFSARAHPCAFFIQWQVALGFLSMTSSIGWTTDRREQWMLFLHWCRLELPLAFRSSSLIYHRTILDNDARIAHHRAHHS